MASTPLPPPPATTPPALLVTRPAPDARSQRRLDAARAARARRRHPLTALTPSTFHNHAAALRRRVAAYIHRNRTANNRANQSWLGAIVFILLSLAFAPILLLLPILAWVISIGVRWGNAPRR